MMRPLRRLFNPKYGLGLVAVALLLGGTSASQAGDGAVRNEQGAIVRFRSQPGPGAHFFRNTTVVSYNSVSNTKRRCNGIFDEPGVGRYVYILRQDTNDSELTCMYIDEAIANGRTVFGFINADHTVNFIEVE